METEHLLGWPVVNLSTCAKFQEGYVNPPQGVPEYFGDDIKWLRAVDLNDSFVHETSRRISFAGFKSAGKAAQLFRAGSLAISKSGTIGRLGILQDKMCGNRAVINIEPLEGFDTRFLFYSLIANRERIIELADGSVQKNLYISQLGLLDLHVPTLLEQQAIAEVLGSLDDKIDQSRRTVTALERLARAMFRAWFVDFKPVRDKVSGATSFPSMPQDVFDALPTRFVDSEMGPLPEGWTLKPLYETARFINGAAFKADHFCNPSNGLPVVKIAELKNGITVQTEFSNRRDLDAKYRIDTGEMLYSWSGSPDTSLDTFLWTKGPGLLNQHIFRIVTEGDAQKHFVYYLLKHLRQPLIEIARDKQTTGLGHVTVADMRRLLVCWPAKDILDGFERQIGPIFDESFALMLESEKLAEVRDYLLPKLLRGRIRVGGK